MKNYKNKIYLFLYVSLVIVLGSFAVLFVNFRKQVKLQNTVLQTETNLIQADSLINNLLQIESDKRGFQLTGDVTYLRKFYHIKTGCRRNISILQKNAATYAEAHHIERTASLINSRLSNLDSGIALFRTEGAAAAVAFMQHSREKNIRGVLGSELALLKTNYLQRLEKTIAAIHAKGNRNVGGLLLLLLVFVILMLVAAKTFRRSQKKMIRNHIKFKDAQRIAKIGSWEWNFTSGKMKWSEEQFRLFGENRKEFVLTIEEYLNHFEPSEQIRTRCIIDDAIRNGTGFSIEHEIVRADGTKLMVFEQGTVYNDEKGRAAGMFGTTQDIAERKKNETELLLARQKFQAIFDNTADGVYQSTFDGRFIMVNPSMARIFGYDSPGQMKKEVTNIAKELYADPVERNKMASLIIEHGHVEDYEIQVLTKNKERIWVSANIRIVKQEDGSAMFFEGTLEDITHRKHSEEQLMVLSNRLQLAVQATGIGIWDWDIQKNTTIWDDEMFRIYGTSHTDERTINQVWEASLHPDDFSRVQKELEDAINGEKNYDTEFRIICSDKSVRHVKGNGLVIRDRANNPIRIIGTNTDITVRKNAEEEILQLNRSLDQFANITAHDLQEPIRMVSGFLGLLDKKYKHSIDEQGQSYINRAKDGADRMTILIRDLLEFSRSGNKVAKKEPVDLMQVMELVNRDLTIAVTDSGSTLNLPLSMPVVTGAQSALYRLFLNLISNGIKFSKKDTAPIINITVSEQNDCFEFAVSDNGIGVPEKDQPKLFQAFQRLHRKEEYPGTGLGLVTCKKIVETHGGKIWMTSVYGKGTTFHFTIPKQQGETEKQLGHLRRA